MRLGLYGGTFDPVHRGHLEVAARALRELRLTRLLWVVAGDPPHKRGRPLTPALHRLHMLELALAGEPRMDVCDAELRRPGPHYTIETLRAFRELWPRAELVFLMGADSLRDLPLWREPRAILDVGVVAAPRPGYDPRPVPAWVRRRARLLPGPHLDIASSEIRARLRRGAEARDGDLPPAVRGYIRAHRLYREARAS